MVTQAEKLLYLRPVSGEGLEARVKELERIIGLLLSDQAIGNTLKGPFRLPGHGNPAAFQ